MNENQITVEVNSEVNDDESSSEEDAGPGGLAGLISNLSGVS